MWQTIVTLALLTAAVFFAVRHFLKVFRTGTDCTCPGCGSAGCCGGKPVDSPHACSEDPSTRY